MNAEQLNAIKERTAKTTPGPWNFDKGRKERLDRRPAVIEHFNLDRGEWFIHGDIADIEDAKFIAHARQDVPALVAEVERYHDMWYHGLGKADAEIQANLHVIEAQQQEIERLRKALEYYADEKHYEPYAIVDVNPCDITEDGGYIAREALSNGEESNVL